MKNLFLLLVIAVMLFPLAQDAGGEVRFTSWNHAVFGGTVRIEGAQKCSARFPKKGVERVTSSDWRYFEVSITLPCDLSGGGRVVIEVNGKPTGFRFPAGVVIHGREAQIVVRHTPFVEVFLTTKQADGVTIVIEMDPQARGGRCELRAYALWPDDEPYREHIIKELTYLKQYLARHTLLASCGKPNYSLIGINFEW